MKFFIIYIITLLTSIQGVLSMLQWTFFALAALRAKEGRSVSGNRPMEPMSNELYYYRGWRRVSRKCLVLFTPAFVVMLALGFVVSSNLSTEICHHASDKSSLLPRNGSPPVSFVCSPGW